jgi:hypothetical protein
MTNPIPDEIRQKALTVAVDCLNTSGFGDETKYARVIARALMAQHNAALEEAAKVADLGKTRCEERALFALQHGLGDTAKMHRAKALACAETVTAIRAKKVKADE